MCELRGRRNVHGTALDRCIPLKGFFAFVRSTREARPLKPEAAMDVGAETSVTETGGPKVGVHGNSKHTPTPLAVHTGLRDVSVRRKRSAFQREATSVCLTFSEISQTGLS